MEALIPSTLVALFLLGMLFEWVYQLNPARQAREGHRADH